MKVKSAVGLLLTMALVSNVAETMAADRRVSGSISKIECGDGTDLSLRLTNRKIIEIILKKIDFIAFGAGQVMQ